MQATAVRTGLAGIGAAAIGLTVVDIATDRWGRDEQLAVALTLGVLLWCIWWARSLSEHPPVATMVAIVVVLAGLWAGLAITDEVYRFGLAGVAAAVVAMVVFLARSASESDRLREQLQVAAAELADARSRAANLTDQDDAERSARERLVQGLSSIQLHARVAGRRSDGEAKRAFELIERTATERLDETRSAPPDSSTAAAASGTSTTQALDRVIERMNRNLGIPGRLEVRGEPHVVPATVELALLRTLQEAVSNVRRHARAGRVEASVTFDDGFVGLEIADDGEGFVASTPVGEGLSTVRRRIEVLGGTFFVDSTPGAGTKLTVTIPLQQPAADGEDG